ncbi:MAG: hypothetical protein KF843_05360 [Flavobacteriales bacterium]|nr:hypothetical protein [Flavobacteriales bacterium]
MSLNEEFDELARRKLEERAFPFAEADWQDARKQIDAARGGRNGAKWITGAAVLLLISGLVWYGTRSSGAEEAIASLEQAAPPSMGVIALDQPVQNETSTPVDGTSEANGPAAATVAKAPSTNSIAVHPVDRSAEARPSVHAAAVKSYARKEEEQNTSEAILTTPVLSKKKVPINTQAALPIEKNITARNPANAEPSAATPNNASVPTTSTNETSTSTTQPTTASTTQPSGGNAISVELNGGDPSGSGTATPAVPPTTNKDAAIATGAGMKVAHTTPGNAPQTVTGTGNTATEHTESPDPLAALVQGSPTGTVATTGSTGHTPVEEADTATTDSMSVVANAPTPPSDSASTAAAAVIPPPLVPERAPWEVSGMGGAYSSTTTYSGSNSAEWNADIGKENNLGVGVELIHMGRNFGIGTGLHYGSYAERIRTDAIDANTTTLHNFWYLMPVDTMILVITDTLPGTPPTFTGTSENSTVNVLTQGTDTTTNSEHLRDARDQVNRVSYFEVPILLDAHLTQGRWMLGLRGGPTIGLLTGRRGAIPAPDNEGYVPFTDLPFRELTLGYTARAYVRYRFNAAWSVGIEPAMRGQLMNSLSSGDLERRSSALGVMMSLTYRLR